MRIVLFVIALAASVSASAQPLYQVTPARTYGAKDTTKKERVFLIFWSAARKEFPPLPFNPFPELPVYDAGTNNFIYDDREVDYPALESAMAKERAQTEAEAKAAALAKDAGGGMALMSMSGWLRLGLPVHDGTNLLLTILGAEEGARHDIYFSTNLSQWSYLFRTATNQTNLTIPPPSASMCFFQLGTLQDLDEDTLPDAYENLITQTDPNAADTPATAGSNTNLAALLTDKPPEIFLKSVLKVFGFEHLFDPCSLPGLQVDKVIDKTVWDSATGGYKTTFFNRKVCLLSNLVEFTEESVTVWQADDTGCFKSCIDNGPWSTGCTNSDGDIPAPPRHGPYGTDWDHETTGEFPPGSGTPTFVATKIKERLQLETRGPALSTNSRIYRLTASLRAWEPDGLTYTNVPPEQIRMLGQTLDADYHTFVMLPDNTPHDVTPKLLSACTTFTFFDVSAERIDVSLMRGGSNITSQAQTVWVGQQMSLQCVLPPGITGSNYSWTVPGTKVADWQYSSTNAQVIPFTITTNSSVLYYWIDKNPAAQVTCAVTVGGLTKTVKATFDVRRPTATWTLTPKGQVAVTTNYCEPDYLQFYALTTGAGCTTNNVGMLFDYQVTDFDGYSGSYNIVFVQTGLFDWKANLYSTSGVQRSWNMLMQGLDTKYPYKNWTVSSSHTDDTPGHALPGTTVYEYRRDQFQSYLMFQPKDGPSIPVPLSLASWQWMGQAILMNGNVSPPQYGLHPYYVSPQGATGTECFAHPTWTNNINNYFLLRKFDEFWYIPSNP